MCIRILSLIILASLTSTAQVWTLPQKEFYINLTYSSGIYDEQYDSTGESIAQPVEVTDNTVSLFTQYGVTDKLTLQLIVPFKLISSTGDLNLFNSAEENPYLETGTLNTIGNIEFGGIYRIYNDKPIITGSVFVEANTSDRNYLSGLQSGFNSWGFKPGVGVAWPFSKSWLTFYLGGDIRTNDYSSSILSNLELGYKPAEYVYFAGVLSLKQSIQNGGDCDCTTTYTSLYLNNQEYVSPGLKSGFIFKRWGFNVGYAAGFAAFNMPVTGYVSAGLQFKSQ